MKTSCRVTTRRRDLIPRTTTPAFRVKRHPSLHPRTGLFKHSFDIKKAPNPQYATMLNSQSKPKGRCRLKLRTCINLLLDLEPHSPCERKRSRSCSRWANGRHADGVNSPFVFGEFPNLIDREPPVPKLELDDIITLVRTAYCLMKW
ncbi:hypothetical protein BJ138DRAFT_720128 [Hygrophoropsis aurantiaca]|uniref:Uncharacterized protein n=1 Tax=Hygrophoropsis aurantiaca TaxID=72124 RepID=A0ACB7ZXG2_9AGAM|nr:hypothetical protein BJ138DRAFT_720128 [Hygrophoropsis aurantiaca]